jgi:hypothetical protein
LHCIPFRWRCKTWPSQAKSLPSSCKEVFTCEKKRVSLLFSKHT